MKKILLLSTGGTIACAEGSDGLTPALTGESLLSYTKEVQDICQIDAVQILNIDSTNMHPEYWINIAEYIEKNYQSYDGFVITHGTDTMAYTSAALFYIIQNSNKPIVITGAQKPIIFKETDAKRNLVNAIQFACNGVGGVFIVFDGKVICGSRAEKLRTKSYNAFESINYPYLASIEDNEIKYNGQVSIYKKEQELTFYKSLCTNIFLLKLTPATDPDILDYLSDKYLGIIIESYGSGGIPFEDKKNFLAKLKMLDQAGKIVVIKTQVLLEGTDLSKYEVGQKALKYPVIPAYDMSTEAIVTKLMWVLGQTKDKEKAKQMFLTPIRNDMIIEKLA
ncbi:asparaginase [Clostridium peptidivorans]|uniref:asparaginase n=1 Tax=Clostridium peptidivorans TaxID=100174 RepID=UPI000BE3AD70|nr:asparaginase [Clostridium peptidivorans]